MPFQFIDDNVQAFAREHSAVLKAVEQYYDEQNIMLQKLSNIIENETDRKPSQAYQAFTMSLAQSLVQQQNRVMSLVVSTAMARVVERKQESIITQVNPRDGDVPPELRNTLDKFRRVE